MGITKMYQHNISYTENGTLKTARTLHKSKNIDEVKESFNKKYDDLHIKFICEVERTDFTISDCKPFSVYKGGKVFSYGFFDEEQAMHSIWVKMGNEKDYYILDDGIIWRGKR
jgi:hypothetical protein